jgi:hypothetical protein
LIGYKKSPNKEFSYQKGVKMTEIVDISLDKDIISQFKNKPNISALQKVLETRLYEVEFFFEQINEIKDIFSCTGQQLDVIGNILGLTRYNASQLALNADFTHLDDDLYRLFLLQKIALNTSNGTYKDMLKNLNVFFGNEARDNFTYSEKPENPATVFWQMDKLFDTALKYQYIGTWRAKYRHI